MSMEKQKKYDRDFTINVIKFYQGRRKNAEEVAKDLETPKKPLERSYRRSIRNNKCEIRIFLLIFLFFSLQEML
jgi:hypothetical protein